MASDRQPLVISSRTSTAWAEREAEIARIAAAQHAQIAFAQLRAAGLSASAIRNRVRTGRLNRVYRGVYSVGRAPASPNEHRMAAVLACGVDATLSHANAAAHLGFRPTAATLIDVTSPTGAGRGIQGIRAHRSTLNQDEVVEVDRIPTTSCARTLFDLAEILAPQALARAFDRAEILGIFDLRALEDVMHRNPGRRAHRPHRALLSSLAPTPRFSRSELEDRFLSLCGDAGLPEPKLNQWLQLEGRYVQADFLWPDRRLIAETDGFATHGTRQAFERDRRRDQLVLRAGYRTIRFTWGQVVDDPTWVADTVRRSLDPFAARSPAEPPN